MLGKGEGSAGRLYLMDHISYLYCREGSGNGGMGWSFDFR